MFDTSEIEVQLGKMVRALAPGELSGPDAVALMERFARLGRLADAGVALCAARVESTEAWRRSGQRDPAGFVAVRTGQHRRAAKDALLVGAAVESASGLDAAVRAGDLSRDQAAEIAYVLGERPDLDAEPELLAAAAAADGSMRALRDTCAQVLARGHGADERDQRANAERSCSAGVGRDGTWRLSASLPPLQGAEIDKALDYFHAAAFDDARRAGAREPFAAYRADALVRMARAALGEDTDTPEPADSTEPGGAGDATDTEGGAEVTVKRRRRGVPRARSSSVRHAIVITVPHSAFWRGHTIAGEACEIPGVGPVPVAAVHDLLKGDPIIKVAVTRGRDVTALATATRTIKEDLRLAVLHRGNRQCGVPGCDARRFVELDHQHHYASGGPTSYPNLRPLCSFHHDQRTNHGYDLRGSPGTHQWVAPDGTILAAERSATPV